MLFSHNDVIEVTIGGYLRLEYPLESFWGNLSLKVIFGKLKRLQLIRIRLSS